MLYIDSSQTKLSKIPYKSLTLREKKRTQVVRGFMRINAYIYSNGPSDSCYENWRRKEEEEKNTKPNFRAKKKTIYPNLCQNLHRRMDELGKSPF